jgi:tetratricopeptide (TPR) repeat protein
MRSAIVVAALLLASAAFASPAGELLERGLRSYAVGRYDEAIAAFARGYELEARPDFLYALGQAQRMKGDCRAAVASYRAYLRTSPPARGAVPARQNLDRCEHELANEPAPTVTPPSVAPPPAVITPPPAVAPPPLPPPFRVRDDRAAAILAGVGGAGIVAGAVLWGVGEAGARSLADATTYDQYAAHGADAAAFGRERTAGIVTLAVGGALVTVAVARWSWLYTHR